METWMISNRQPWVYALVNGLITSKTRSRNVSLPPVGATVLLHASKALWVGWRRLFWTALLDVKGMNRGGIVAVAKLVDKGLTPEVMPAADYLYFELDGLSWRSCAGPATMVFADLRPLEFIPCRGFQVPTRKIPADALPLLRAQGIDV